MPLPWTGFQVPRGEGNEKDAGWLPLTGPVCSDKLAIYNS